MSQKEQAKFRTIGVFDNNCNLVGKPLYGAVMTHDKAEKKVAQFQSRFPQMQVGYC